MYTAGIKDKHKNETYNDTKSIVAFLFCDSTKFLLKPTAEHAEPPPCSVQMENSIYQSIP